MENDAVQNIVAVVGVIVGVSLALSQALGGLLTYLVEAIKGTGKIPDGYSGLVSIALGIGLGAVLGALADAMAAEPYGIGTMLMVGGFAGALMAAGSIKTFKAMGQVNTMPAYVEGEAAAKFEITKGPTLSPVSPATRHSAGDIDKAVDFMKELEWQHTTEGARQKSGPVDPKSAARPTSIVTGGPKPERG